MKLNALVYLVVCLYIGVIIGTYVKLRHYEVKQHCLVMSIILFPWLLKKHVWFVIRKVSEEKYRSQTFRYRIKTAFSLYIILLQFTPMFIGLAANTLARIKPRSNQCSNIKVLAFKNIRKSTVPLYNKLYTDIEAKYA